MTAGKTIAAVESVKAAADVYSPVSGEVVASNDALGDEPGMHTDVCTDMCTDITRRHILLRTRDRGERARGFVRERDKAKEIVSLDAERDGRVFSLVDQQRKRL